MNALLYVNPWGKKIVFFAVIVVCLGGASGGRVGVSIGTLWRLSSLYFTIYRMTCCKMLGESIGPTPVTLNCK